jgi:hypothetical protein
MKSTIVTKVTKQSRLLEALRKGQALSEAQIRSRFDIANPRATISDLREVVEGHYTINAVRKTAKNGATTTKYQLEPNC